MEVDGPEEDALHRALAGVDPVETQLLHVDDHAPGLQDVLVHHHLPVLAQQVHHLDPRPHAPVRQQQPAAPDKDEGLRNTETDRQTDRQTDRDRESGRK